MFLHLSFVMNIFFVFSDQRNFIDNDIYIQKYSNFQSVFSEPILLVDNFFIDDNVPDWMMIRLLLAGSIAGDSLNQKDDDLITDFASPSHCWQSIESNLKSAV